METKYKILGGDTTIITNTIVTTDVEFTFEDGTVEVITIPHFNPKDDEDIIKGIENRFITEQEQRNNIVE